MQVGALPNIPAVLLPTFQLLPSQESKRGQPRKQGRDWMWKARASLVSGPSEHHFSLWTLRALFFPPPTSGREAFDESFGALRVCGHSQVAVLTGHHRSHRWGVGDPPVSSRRARAKEIVLTNAPAAPVSLLSPRGAFPSTASASPAWRDTTLQAPTRPLAPLARTESSPRARDRPSARLTWSASRYAPTLGERTVTKRKVSLCTNATAHFEQGSCTSSQGTASSSAECAPCSPGTASKESSTTCDRSARVTSQPNAAQHATWFRAKRV